MSGRVWTSIVLGSFIRLSMFYTNFSPILQKRVEISTPLNSWINVQEGLYLMKRNITPYEGDTLHETPLTLVLADYLTQLPALFLYIVFVFCDVITALVLASSVEKAKAFYMKRTQTVSKFADEFTELKVLDEDNYGEYVILCYLLNPFTILSCVGLTTTVFGNLATALAILGMFSGFRLVASVTLALSVYQSLYPITLVFPLVICIYDNEMARAKSSKVRKPSLSVSVTKSLLAFGVSMAVLVYISHSLTKGYDFLDRTYGFILNVRDLKPNIGLFWYFFTEMFEHFHLLFIFTFQINAFIYIVPLTLRFYKEPALLIYSFCAIMSIFKSYPCVGDVGFYLAMLPMWTHLVPFMQQKFIVACFFIATSVLAPIQWYLWIYSGSANANFYFGVTIAFGTAQIFLLTDVLLSHLKREYYLKNGIAKEVDGKPAGLALH